MYKVCRDVLGVVIKGKSGDGGSGVGGKCERRNVNKHAGVEVRTTEMGQRVRISVALV